MVVGALWRQPLDSGGCKPKPITSGNSEQGSHNNAVVYETVRCSQCLYACAIAAGQRVKRITRADPVGVSGARTATRWNHEALTNPDAIGREPVRLLDGCNAGAMLTSDRVERVIRAYHVAHLPGGWRGAAGRRNHQPLAYAHRSVDQPVGALQFGDGETITPRQPKERLPALHRVTGRGASGCRGLPA
jgi:hypothetical protein